MEKWSPPIFYAAVSVFAVLLISCGCSGRASPSLLVTKYGVFDPSRGSLPDLKDISALPDPDRAAKLVVFKERILPAWRQTLLAHGINIRGYLPNNTFIVTASVRDVQWLRRLPMVSAVMDEPRLWRYDARLVQHSGQGFRLHSIAELEDLTIEMADWGTRAQVVAWVQQAGGHVVETAGDASAVTGGLIHVRIGLGSTIHLVQHPDITFISPWVPAHFFSGEPFKTVDSWAIAPLASGHGIQGVQQAVAVCGAMDANMALPDVLYTQDAATAGAGLPDNVEALLGMAYSAGARVYADAWTLSDVAYGPVERSIDAFVVSHSDLLVLSSQQDGPVAPGPATAKNVLAVGSTEPGDAPGSGAAADGRTKPTLRTTDVAAAAGSAALVRQYFTDGFYPSGEACRTAALQPSAALVKALLLAGAHAVPGESNVAGYGHIDADNGLYFGGLNPRLWVRDDATGLNVGEGFSATLSINAGASLDMALAWMDEPGCPTAATPLVNDLDLYVRAPDGQLYFGNSLQDGVSQVGGRADVCNTEEVIHLPRAEAGIYEVHVVGHNVPLGPQPYGLVIMGSLDSMEN